MFTFLNCTSQHFQSFLQEAGFYVRLSYSVELSSSSPEEAVSRWGNFPSPADCQNDTSLHLHFAISPTPQNQWLFTPVIADFHTAIVNYTKTLVPAVFFNFHEMALKLV